jgi:hypothetical protein
MRGGFRAGCCWRRLDGYWGCGGVWFLCASSRGPRLRRCGFSGFQQRRQYRSHLDGFADWHHQLVDHTFMPAFDFHCSFGGFDDGNDLAPSHCVARFDGCVVSPLFSAFGPEPIATRLNIGKADVLVTTKAIYQRKIAAIRGRLPSVRQILLIDAECAHDRDVQLGCAAHDRENPAALVNAKGTQAHW